MAKRFRGADPGFDLLPCGVMAELDLGVQGGGFLPCLRAEPGAIRRLAREGDGAKTLVLRPTPIIINHPLGDILLVADR